MISKTLKNYGGPKADVAPAEDPTTQLSSPEYNSLAEDCAQLTRTPARAIVAFVPGTGAAAPVLARAVSIWGSGVLQQPAITRVSAGQYRLTYPTSFADANSVSEAVSFSFCLAAIGGGVVQGNARASVVTANIVDVWTLNGSWFAADLGNVEVTVWIF